MMKINEEKEKAFAQRSLRGKSQSEAALPKPPNHTNTTVDSSRPFLLFQDNQVI